MKYLVFISFILCAIEYSAAGQPKTKPEQWIDSVKLEIAKAKEDTSKAKLLYKLSYMYVGINSDEGIKYGQQGFDLSEKFGWGKGMGASLDAIAQNYKHNGDYTTALKYFDSSLKVNTRYGVKRSIAANLGNIAGVYEHEGNLTKALTYEFEDLKIAEELNDVGLVASCYEGIGNIYIALHDYVKAEKFHKKAIAQFEILGDKSSIGNVLQNMGSSYYYQQKYDEAIEFTSKALDIFRNEGIKSSIMSCTGNLGNIYSAIKNYPKALELEFESLKLAENLKKETSYGGVAGEVGQCYLRIAQDTGKLIASGQYMPKSRKESLEKAIAYLKTGIQISQKTSNSIAVIEYLQSLATAQKLAGNYKDAFESLSQCKVLQDSLFSADNRINIAKQETRREAELKEKQVELNKLESVKKQNERILFGSGFILLLLVIIAVLKNAVTQRRANKQQAEALQQKEVLMKEIHHRVKNNLQVIGTLLELQVNNVTDQGAKDAMTESMTRVHSISLIHQQLYQNEHMASIELSRFTATLMEQLSAVFKKPGQNITFINEIPELFLDIDTGVPIGLILNELITNSFKYAFAGNDGARIEVRISHTGKSYEMAYRDSGPGLPADIDPDKSKSLGLRLIRSLSRQAGGRFVYNRQGKVFFITFKDALERKNAD